MNKVITDGLTFMPLPFSEGLSNWSSGDGTPGSDTYDGAGGGTLITADAQFSSCLEIVKDTSTKKLRYMGQTPILPGCYLQITVRLKAMSGALPSVRIAGWAAKDDGTHATGLVEFAEAVELPAHGEIVTLRGIIGTGFRRGVDMSWPTAGYGHIGIDLVGPNGGVIRVDDIEIEDVTNVFIRDMIGVVDVRDYGAIGDGATDDSAAFEAADANANGREVLVSEGVFYLADHVTIDNQVHFQGTVTMPENKQLILRKNFNYETYADAFADEEVAFKKAFQALLNYSDHESLDLGGRRIRLTGPIDMQAAEGTKNDFAIRRVIRNGQFEPSPGGSWNPDIVTSQASYSPSNHKKLTNVTNVAAIPVGAHLTGHGVGREIYVTAVNVSQNTVDISQPLFDADGVQNFTFSRYKYMLDFSGFTKFQGFAFESVDFHCNGIASGIMLAPSGIGMHFKDCKFNKPADRAITSTGEGCQGMMIDRCEFISNESGLPVSQRQTVCFNVNANDPKIRNSRVVHFKHFCVLSGTGNLIAGNHWFHGDNEPDGLRLGGIILTQPNCKSAITGNYIDNNFIEWTNEHDATPDFASQYSFGGLTITGNFFTANDVANWFNWIVVKPYGVGHFINGFSVVGNSFRTVAAKVNKLEKIDTSYADLDRHKFSNIVFSGNSFHGVEPTVNPVEIKHTEASDSNTWTIGTDGRLPFGGYASFVSSVVGQGKLSASNGAAVFDLPYAETEIGNKKDEVRLRFGTPCKGTVVVKVRADTPA